METTQTAPRKTLYSAIQPSGSITLGNYIGALRRLSRTGDPSVLVKAMTRLRDFSRRLIGDDISAMRRQMEESNAFKDDDNFTLQF